MQEIDDVNIRQKGNRSKHLVEIVQQTATGTMISHILNYKVSREPTNKAHALDIRRMLKSAIWRQQNFEQVVTIPGVTVNFPIMWNMPTADQTCAYYYTDAGFTYSSSAIKKHTCMMLQRITRQIRAQRPEYGSTWGLAYLVTRTLDAAVLQAQGDPIQQLGYALGVGGAEDDDDEEEEEGLNGF